MNPFSDTRWWLAEDNANSRVFAAIDRIKGQNSVHEASVREALELFGGRPISGFTQTALLGGHRQPTNLVRRCTSSIISETVQNKPRPMAVTTEGDYELRQRADKLTRWCDGLFHDTRFYDFVAPAVALDGILLGTGFVHVYFSGGKIHHERVFPSEIYVDEQDGMYGCPRTIYRVKYYDRYQAAELWKEHSDKILTAPNPSSEWSAGRDTTSDQILVAEAWHLPSGPDAEDGRHVIAIQGCDLLVEDYELDRFPLIKTHWEDPILGYWGTGVAEILAPIQFQLNRLNQRIEEAQYLLGNARLMLPRGANIAKQQLTNGCGDYIEYDGGQPPMLVTGPTISPEIYQQRQWLIQTAFEELGISQLAVQSQKPAGLNSGRALRVFEDQGSKRFLRWHNQWEALHVAVAEISIELMKKAADEDKGYEVVYRGKGKIEKIDWSDVDIDDDAYCLQVFPTSILPTTPAGRLATIDDMSQSGLSDKLGIGPEQLQDMLDIPDLSATTSRAKAPLEAVQKAISAMLSSDEYVPPEPYLNLQLALGEATKAYLEVYRDNVPEERLENLRRYIADVQDLMAPPEPAQTMPPPMGPPTEPAPPPEMAPPAPPMAA